MSQDFYQKALQEFPAYASQIVPTTSAQKFVEVLTPNKRKVKMLSTHKVIAQNRRMLAVQPSTTVPVGLLNGGQLDFRLESGLVDTLDYCMVQLNLTNSSGGASVLAPAQYLVNRIDIYAQNGSVLIKQIYGHELFLENIYLGRSEFENFSASLGLTTAYASAATSIANTGTAELYIPIWSPFYSARLNLAGLQGQILIRVLFNPTALTHASGALVDTTDCKLIARGRDLINSVADSYVQTYRGGLPVQLNFMNIQRMSQTLSLVASSTYSIVMSGIRGICSVLLFTVRPAALTASNILTMSAMLNYDIQQSDGSSINGFQRRNAQQQLLDYGECFDNLMQKNVNIHCISFSQDPVLDFSQASNSGYQAFSSFEKLSFTTPAGLSSANYQIDIVAFVHDALNIDKGVMTATRN